MSLRSEIADRMDSDRALLAYPGSRAAFRAGQADSMGFGTLGNDVARTVLSVCDEYEEVEVEECRGTSGFVCRGDHWLRMPDDRYWGQPRHNPNRYTILRCKQKPEPNVTELARRAVKAFRGGPNIGYCRAMQALAEAVDE